MGACQEYNWLCDTSQWLLDWGETGYFPLRNLSRVYCEGGHCTHQYVVWQWLTCYSWTYILEAQKELSRRTENQGEPQEPTVDQQVATPGSIGPSGSSGSNINPPDASLLWLHPTQLGYDVHPMTRYKVGFEKSFEIWLINISSGPTSISQRKRNWRTCNFPSYKAWW